MKMILKVEELGQFVLGMVLFSQLQYDWWVFLVWILVPDIGILGYFINLKVGAITYNVFHHKGIAIMLLLLGMFFLGEVFTLAGIILFSHASMDRIFGYGLKYSDSFKHTHLGIIGKN
jgi:hypothetical protein